MARVLRSMGARLALLLVLVQVVAFGAFTLSSILQQRAAYLQASTAAITRNSDVLRASLRSAMRDKRWSDIDEALHRVIRDGDIQSVELIGHRGRLYAAAGAPARAAFTSRDQPCLACHRESRPHRAVAAADRSWVDTDARVLNVWSVVRTEERCGGAGCHGESPSILGVMRVRMSLRAMDLELGRTRNRLLAIGGLALLLALGAVWLVVANWLHRPVRALAEATRAVAAGNLEIAVPRRSDELGEVADSLNELCRRLKSSRDQMVRTANLVAAGKLAAGVAHEINNPLTGILSYAEDLLESAAPDDARREDYAIIVRETLRCRGLVRNLLDFARQTGPELTAARLDRVVEDTVRLVHKQAAFRNVSIEQQHEPGLPQARVDPKQMQQVLLNLLVNAAEAMPQGGRVTITTAAGPEPAMAVVTVSDTGSGIPGDIRERIFEPFFSTKGGKTDGFGLAISWSIVQGHGGTIEVDSAVGRGTTFRIRLPLARS
ncbi:MAG: HAMP domain-containing protein [Deltaproteobacteria bacterium]|nr:HAMP domain-containing protein [Deltaproteobacteria bacterium]